MLKNQLKCIGDGEDSHLCVLSLPPELVNEDMPVSCMTIPVLLREEGVLLAIPSDFVSAHNLLEAQSADDFSMLGPSKLLQAALLEEDESGVERRLDDICRCLLLDVSNDCLPFLREYDVIQDPGETIQPFSVDRPAAIVDVKAIMDQVFAWLDGVGGAQRVHFYSAREEPPKAAPAALKAGKKAAAPKKVTTAVLSQQVDALTIQMQLLASQHEELMKIHLKSSATPAVDPGAAVGTAAKLPAVSAGLSMTPAGVPKTARLIGPPPKAKQPGKELGTGAGGTDTGEALEDMVNVGPDQMTHAIMQQSAALTSLVAHLTTGDAMADLSTPSGQGQSLSTKGVARREKMQQDLSSGNSNYFLQMQQQLYKRMCPTRQIPKTEEELVGSGVSMIGYLERFGGFRNKPEAAMLMWLLAHCVDAAASGDMHLVKEYLALTVTSVDQSCLDGNWSIAFLISLLEEPPAQVYMEKTSSVSSLGRPFSPLIPASWAAVALAYLKEMELLNSKKSEARGKASSPKAAGSDQQPLHLRRDRSFRRSQKGEGTLLPRQTEPRCTKKQPAMFGRGFVPGRKSL